MKCVIERCNTERRELASQHLRDLRNSSRKKSKTQDRQKLTEALRICLFGIPGAGKSSCLKLLRSYFEEVLGWVDGDEFQFLASQNTMAALIGGQTIHHWSTIPVNAEKAGQKTKGKASEGDVDALFLKVQGMRWLVVDEASTASLRILDLLDSYLRRACSRHPYAKAGKKPRPFGGINLIFSGDLWQLPPVKGKSIFSNPFRGGLSAGEQKT